MNVETWPEGFKMHGARTAWAKNMDQLFCCSACQNWILMFTMGLGAVDRGRWDERGNVFCKKCAAGRIVISKDPISRDDIPAEYALATMDNVDKTIATRLRDWPAKPFLMLMGAPGTGKTYALWAMAKDFATRGRYVHFIDCATFRAQWVSGNVGRRAELEQRLNAAPLLILDDITKADPTDGWLQRMEVCFDQRTKNHLPTLCATMKTPVETAAHFGQALASRFKFFSAVITKGNDRRVEKAGAA